METGDLIPIRYVDDNDKPTMKYPLNPNGSPNGIAGLCSSDGRHLALMPHPERSFLAWQWPNWPQCPTKEWERGKSGSALMSPWFKMFENAYNWCAGIEDDLE